MVCEFARHIEVSGVCEQVLEDAEVGVEAVGLGYDAERELDGALIGADILAVDEQIAAADRGYARKHLHRGGFAGAVRAEEAETFALGDVEANAVDRCEFVESLGQIACVNSRLLLQIFVRCGSCALL